MCGPMICCCEAWMAKFSFARRPRPTRRAARRLLGSVSYTHLDVYKRQQVFTTAGTDEKCATCVALGADYAFNYKTQKFAEEIRRITDGRGVDVILDMVAGGYTQENLDSLAMRGRLVQIAVQQGANVTVNLAKIMQKRLTVTGSTLRPRSIEEKATIAQELKAHAWPLLESGKVKVVIDKIVPFAKVREAHEYFERGTHVGKVILEI